VKTLKALKETVACVYSPSLGYGDKQSFLFTDMWTKEKKTVNYLFTERKVTIICTYLSATH